MKKLFICVTTLFSTNLLAHPGHLPAESVHSLLHIEHITGLITIVAISLFIKRLRNK